MKKAIITYENLSASSGYQSDAQRFTPPHWFSKGAVSLLIAVLFSILFCSCGKDDLPASLSSDTRVSDVRLETLIPNTQWHLTGIISTVGDVNFNAAWAKMELKFTSDSAFFYRNDNVYDPVSHTTTPEKTLCYQCFYRINTPKITLEATDFEVQLATPDSIILKSPQCSLRISRKSPPTGG